MMARNILIIFLLTTFFSCSKEDVTIVKVELDQVANAKVIIEELRLSGNKVIVSKEISSRGRFKTSIPMKIAGYYQLRIEDGPSLVLVLEPGEKVVIRGNLEEFHKTKTIEGSENTERVSVLHDSLRYTIQQLNSLKKTYFALDTLENIPISQLDSLSEEFQLIREKHRKFTFGFILEDLTSLANIAALYQEFDDDDFVLGNTRDLQFFKLVSDSLSKYYPRVRYVRGLKDNYKNIFSQYQQAKLLEMATPLEMDVPDLELPNIKGNSKKLSSLKGNIVLLTFWSVAQEGSRTNVIELQRVYKKHHSKGFEIYQVAIDHNIRSWQNAVRFEDIPWISAIDTAYPTSKTRMFFNVNTVPMNYLINEEQSKILAKNISPQTLDKVLSSLFDN